MNVQYITKTLFGQQLFSRAENETTGAIKCRTADSFETTARRNDTDNDNKNAEHGQKQPCCDFIQ
jgi:hypothetical protein